VHGGDVDARVTDLAGVESYAVPRDQ